MSPDSTESLRQVTDALSQSLTDAFSEVCPERYGGPLTLTRLDDRSDPQKISFLLKGPGTIELKVFVAVSHVGGNVYDVVAQVEEESPHCFTHSAPVSAGSSPPEAPYLGKKVARHVLDDIERRLGQKVLSDQAAVKAA